MAQAHKFRKAKSLFSTTLSVGISTGTGETITLSSAVGLPTDTEITLTLDRVDADGVGTPAKLERITGIISGSGLITYTRGIDSTTDQAHSAGCVIEYIWNADDLNDIVDGILVDHGQTGAHKSGLKLQATYEDWVSDSDSATITFNMATSNRHKVTIEANRTLAVSGVQTGQAFIVRLTQGSGGSKTVTWWSTISWPDGTAPTLTTTAAKTDVFGFIVTGSATYDGFIIGQNL